MLSHVYSKQLPAKAKATKLSLGALVSNNLANSYTLTNLTEQVIRNKIYL
jgi:hypothetical protein